MNIQDHPLRGIGPYRILLAGSFAPNTASNPVAASSRGRDFGHTFVVTYAATGVFTVTWPSGFTLPAQPSAIIVTSQCDAIANGFEVTPIGDTTLVAVTRTLVIQAHRALTPFAPAVATGTRINFSCTFQNGLEKDGFTV